MTTIWGWTCGEGRLHTAATRRCPNCHEEQGEELNEMVGRLCNYHIETPCDCTETTAVETSTGTV